jgi:hypothetical protein
MATDAVALLQSAATIWPRGLFWATGPELKMESLRTMFIFGGPV